MSELAEHHAARDRIVMEIINKWDDWDAEALQLSQQHQNDIAWMWFMRERLTEVLSELD